MRRSLPLVDSGRPSADPPPGAWVTVTFTYQGLTALGVPQSSLDSFAPEFRQGMAARAAVLGDVGESGPANWEKPLGTGDVHVALAALSTDAGRLRALVEQGRQRRRGASGRGADLAAGLLPAPDRRTSFGFRDGIGQPTVEGSGIPPRIPRRSRSRPVRSSSVIRKALIGAKMVGRWQSGAPLALSRNRMIPNSAPTSTATTTSFTRTTRAASSVRPARTHDARTPGTRSTTREASTYASTT